jgi:NAD(P)-dependent dehydrogenase (short-subunit alcohol dehydrogenase family)
MRTAAKEMAGRGIRVNSVHPGPTDTAFQRAIEVSATGAPPDVAARIFEARVPLSWHACAEEIARSVLFLASPDSSLVTGAALPVDGACTCDTSPFVTDLTRYGPLKHAKRRNR